ncbi:MAG: phage holin family protein [Lawsonibacter sp.]
MDFGIVSVGAITVVCYLVAQAVKATALDNKWLPVLCGLMGGILGVAALYTGLDGFPATDPLSAAAVGIVSGLAATGANQIVKQLNQ